MSVPCLMVLDSPFISFLFGVPFSKAATYLLIQIGNRGWSQTDREKSGDKMQEEASGNQHTGMCSKGTFNRQNLSFFK